jgi:hypothetical protein
MQHDEIEGAEIYRLAEYPIGELPSPATSLFQFYDAWTSYASSPLQNCHRYAQADWRLPVRRRRVRANFFLRIVPALFFGKNSPVLSANYCGAYDLAAASLPSKGRKFWPTLPRNPRATAATSQR